MNNKIVVLNGDNMAISCVVINELPNNKIMLDINLNETNCSLYKLMKLAHMCEGQYYYNDDAGEGRATAQIIVHESQIIAVY